MSDKERGAAYVVAKREEGLKLESYADRGGFSIGYGHFLGNIEHMWITEQVADSMLRGDILQAESDALSKVGMEGWDKLSPVRRVCLILMLFQLGATRAEEFKKFFNALKAEDYQLASAEMLNSAWAEQTPARVQRLAFMMRTNEIHPDYLSAITGKP